MEKETNKNNHKPFGLFGYLSPYIIAEIGVNHEGDVAKAKAMIDQVARAGGHAAKFQTYKADKIASKDHAPYYWDLKEESSTSQHQLFQKYDKFGHDEYQELADHCRKAGIDFLSTPFDLEAVDELDPLLHIFKIASADITHVPLLRRVGSKKKRVILSTGASTLEEIEAALKTLRQAGAPDITLLHCVLNYPTPKGHAQLALMHVLKRHFGDQCAIGYSDHVAPEKNGEMPALEFAVINGAVVIEKHFTFDKSLPGNDHYHAMNEADLKAFIEKLEGYRLLYGSEQRQIQWEQKAIAHARRRIMAARNIQAGEELTKENLTALRSEVGIEVAQWDSVLGRKSARLINADHPIEWKDIE